jgi:hypothetical protein
VSGKPSFADIRPRNAGEILDDAWRLYLADGPFLLAISSLFTAPALLFLIWLLARPAPVPPGQQWLLAAAGAILIPIMGFGSAACQEAFRRRAEGETPGWGDCLRPIGQQGWAHAAARALLVILVFLGSWVLLVPGLVIWVASAAVHPILAATPSGPWQVWQASRRQMQRQWGKAAAVVLLRLPLLVVVLLNLHLFVRTGLWIGDHLAGFDLAFTELQLTLKNPAYAAALLILAWLLLAPFIEAANFLLHVDARARYEGLDLWYRVRRHLGVGLSAQRAAGLLAVLLLCCPLTRANAADTRLEEVRQIRTELRTIRAEVADAEPYRGGARWQPRLQALARRLEHGAQASRGRLRWLQKEIAGFAQRSRDGALAVLAGIDARLALLEDSLADQERSPTDPDQGQAPLTNAQLRELLPPETGKQSSREQEKPEPVQRTESKRRPQPAEPESPAPAGGRGPGLVRPQPAGGFTLNGWAILAGLLLAVVLVAFLRRPRGKGAQTVPAKERGQEPPSLESLLTRPEGPSVAALWRQADEQAQSGNPGAALRTLYLAVLALLHRSNRIRYERTRTNGEYLRQLQQHEELQEPFGRMTRQFEATFYGARTGGNPDYVACRSLAETIRTLTDRT